MMTELEKQRDYVAKMNRTKRPCPHCEHNFSAEDVGLEGGQYETACPACGGEVRDCMALWGGELFWGRVKTSPVS